MLEGSVRRSRDRIRVTVIAMGKGRLEDFTDGVIAIIVTIMMAITNKSSIS
jgi:hypothetical protein